MNASVKANKNSDVFNKWPSSISNLHLRLRKYWVCDHPKKTLLTEVNDANLRWCKPTIKLKKIFLKKVLWQERMTGHTDDDFVFMAVVYSCIYDQIK